MKKTCLIQAVSAALSAFLLLPFLSACKNQELQNQPYPRDDLPSTVQETEVLAEVDLAGLDAMCAALRTLLDACASRSMTCSKETAAAGVLEYSVSMIKKVVDEGKDQKLPSRRLYSLNLLYTQTKDALLSYLDGEAEPISVPEYDCATLSVDGNHMVASYGGEAEPAYMIGYGHWISSLQDYFGLLDEMSMHVVQVDIQTHGNVIVPRGQGSHEGLAEDDAFDLNYDYLRNEVAPFLDTAAEHNIAVCLLLSAQFMPDFIHEAYPEIEKLEESNHKFSVHSEKALYITEKVIRATMEVCGDKTALFNICIANEPTYFANICKTDRPYWTAYLKDNFESVEALNTTLGTAYASFEEIEMPMDSTAGTGIYYLYCCFNNQLYAEYLNFCNNIIKSYRDIPINSKVWAFMPWIFGQGLDEEALAPYTGILGCDAFNFLEENRYDKQMWYAYLSSIADAPIFNSEDHLDRDGKVDEIQDWYTPETFAAHAYMDMWEGAVNGRTISTIWTMPWFYRDEEYGKNGNVNDHPLAMAKIAEAAMDLNRFHNEVAALNDADTHVYVLYSKCSMLFDSEEKQFEALQFAFRSSLTIGEKIGLATETTVKDLGAEDCIIIPDCNYLPDETFDALTAFAENGGRVVLLSDCLEYNEYGMERDQAKIDALKELAKTYRYEKGSSSAKSFLRFMQEEYGFNTTVTCDGKPLTYVAAYGVPYDDGVLMKLANYSVSGVNENITLTYNGQEITDYTDLLTGTHYTDGEALDLSPSQCALLFFKP